MNPAAPLLRLLRRTTGVPPTAPAIVPPRSPRHAAPRVLAWFAAAVLTLHAAALLSMDAIWPHLRDPEYGRRLTRLKARMVEHPDRPVAVVIGSSRISMGLRPDAWEESRPNGAKPDPLLFNMSLVGSGPVMELLCLRRLYADGVRPDAIVIEYWPPFLREDGIYFEPNRIVPERLYRSDRDFVREFFPHPEVTEQKMWEARVNPVFENRQRWLLHVFPSWVPWHRRLDATWTAIDPWGWLPGLDVPNPQEPHTRAARLAHCEPIYREQFDGFFIHPLATRAIRDTVALARENGAKVALVYLPESTEFRTWVPPAVERAGRDHLNGLCRELDVPLIDAKLWLEDGLLVDGFHPSRLGAAEFTRRFGPAVADAFPDLTRRK